MSASKHFLRSLQYTKKEITSYDMRGEQVIEVKESRDSCAYERTSLQTPDPLKQDSLPKGSVQSFFPGKFCSTTAYNEGQRYYYSPLGVGFQVSEAGQVIANFKADGNVGQTCNLDFQDSKGRTLIQNACLEIINNDKLKEIILKDAEHKDFFLSAEKLEPINHANAESAINKLLKKYPESTETGSELRQCIQSSATNILVDYYKKTGHQGRYSGFGLSPNKEFNEAEKCYREAKPGSEVIIDNDKGKYTECVIHSTSENLDFVFVSIDTECIPYPDLIDDKWLIKQEDETVITSALNARLNSLIELHDELKKAKPTLKFALLDKNGVLYTTPDIKHIQELSTIITKKDKNWLNTVEEKIQQNFTPISSSSINEAQIWEADQQHNDIDVVRGLPPQTVNTSTLKWGAGLTAGAIGAVGFFALKSSSQNQEKPSWQAVLGVVGVAGLLGYGLYKSGIFTKSTTSDVVKNKDAEDEQQHQINSQI